YLRCVEQLILRRFVCSFGANINRTFFAQLNESLTVEHRLLILAALYHQAEVNRAGAQWRWRRERGDDERACRLLELHGPSVGARPGNVRDPCDGDQQHRHRSRDSCSIKNDCLALLPHQSMPPILTSLNASSRASAWVETPSTRLPHRETRRA